MITSQLPPWITPTLPEAAIAPTNTLPPNIVPTLPETPETTTSSGCIVVRDEFSQAATGAQLVATQG